MINARLIAAWVRFFAMVSKFSVSDTCRGGTALLVGTALLPCPVLAQLMPDNSLGHEASVVVPDVPIQGTAAVLIEGGAMRGSSLFHSFSEFNIETLQRVYFANPTSIETILTRVTGGNHSLVDGTLGVNGSADLYLLNPNGIAFGPNAQLDIRGSFLASTADAWHLENGEVFSAVDPAVPPLLSITLTPGLQYGAAQREAVSNDGNLTVDPGESLTLLGETVTHTGTLTAPGGTIQLLGDRVGVFEAGQIDVSALSGGGQINIGGGWQGQGPLPQARETVVGPQAVVVADGTKSGNGGEIILWSEGVTRFYGHASAQGGNLSGNGGVIEVSGLEQLVFEGTADTTAAQGIMGVLLLDPTNIQIVGNSLAETADLGDVDNFADADIGSDGDTLIAASAIANATTAVILQATNSIAVDEPIVTNGESITLDAPNIVVRDSITSGGGEITLLGENSITVSSSAIIEAGDSFSGGGAGNVTVQTAGSLSFIDGGQLRNTAFGSGKGGETTIAASAIVAFGSGISGASGIATRSLSSGAGGNATVTADSIAMANGALIAIVSEGEGSPGQLSVTADQINLTDSAGILSEARAASTGGAVIVDVGNLEIASGAFLITNNQGQADGGNLSVTANQITVDGVAPGGDPVFEASIIGAVGTSSGRGGNAAIAADTIQVTGGGTLSTGNAGVGDAGHLSITADLIALDGFLPVGLFLVSPSSINSRTFDFGNSGDVDITAGTLLIRNGANIATLNSGTGTTGRLTVSADRIDLDGVAAPLGLPISASSISSQVTAAGDGGDVVVTADEISVTNGATLATSNLGSGTSGDLTVTAEQIQVSATASDTGSILGTSLIGSQVFATGDGGNVVVNATDIAITAGAVISTANLGSGSSGSLTVTAEAMTLDGFTGLGPTEFGASSINSQVLGPGTGGAIAVTADTLSLSNGANISSSNFGSGTSGDVSVTAGQLEVDGFAAVGDNLLGPTGILAEVLASGNGGDINIVTDTLNVTRGASISSPSVGNGHGGDVSITANLVNIDGFTALDNATAASNINSLTTAAGSGGNINLQANTVSLTDGALIGTTASGDGSAGNINIRANQLQLDGFGVVEQMPVSTSAVLSLVQGAGDGGSIDVEAETVAINNGAAISTSTFGAGNGGNIAVTAAQVELAGAFPIGLDLFAPSNISSEVFSAGDGGAIAIAAQEFSAISGAAVSTTNSGEGKAGGITLTAPDITLTGVGSGLASTIGAAGTGAATGGDITVTTANIDIVDGAIVSTATLGDSDAGAIAIQAGNGSVELDAGVISSISTTNRDGGDITLTAGDITLANVSGIQAGTFTPEEAANAAEASAGTITVTANTLFLETSELSTTGNQGNGGDIFLTVSDFIFLRNGSLISTSAGQEETGGGTGGNILVDTPFLSAVLAENSDITANAFTGNGGQVTVTALDIVGLEFQDELTPFSDITASSTAGGLPGVTEFVSLTDINIEEGLSALPTDLADPTTLINQQCALQASGNASQFTVVGRGGLPADPSQGIAPDRFLEDLGPSASDAAIAPLKPVPPLSTPALSTPTSIREAQGWVQDSQGQVRLVAAASPPLIGKIPLGVCQDGAAR